MILNICFFGFDCERCALTSFTALWGKSVLYKQLYIKRVSLEWNGRTQFKVNTDWMEGRQGMCLCANANLPYQYTKCVSHVCTLSCVKGFDGEVTRQSRKEAHSWRTRVVLWLVQWSRWRRRRRTGPGFCFMLELRTDDLLEEGHKTLTSLTWDFIFALFLS